MMTKKANWVLGFAALAGGIGFGAAAWAQQGNYPSRPVTLVVPFPAGGTTDATARALAQKLGEQLKQPVVVDNKAGAGASLGAGFVAKAKPDGYTLLVGSLANMVVNSYVYKNLPYNPQKDLLAVHGVMSMPIVIAARGNLPQKTLKDVIESSKTKPEGLTYGSAGNGSVSHLTAEQMKTQTHAKLEHVPYKGSAPAITDLLAGNIDLAFDYAATTAPYFESGKLIPLAVTSTKRLAILPQVPTLAELGYPQASVTSWLGIFVPAGTPVDVVSKLGVAIREASRNPTVQDVVKKQGGEAFDLNGSELKSFVDAEHKRWRPVIENLGLTPN
ncbi:tripartite tricarboxylate transporter substrate binding protein [Diaphorobacter sp. HDW4A]|uniref:Bug family tripartite tricarboxylate transporter substrate binding protein n=1 Tax=Diaphorobacter sp. HDW4A TaxID=2714924 RepID=UPI00140B25BC|nr:tripartite tricarboxylate transporter substrate binding protein [Diaphorobacter sp. HDW4A]QIL80032.1 tripartite tricarboxylate transporter substrate binding protein [Diaphorobacter sp. HDW4A]